MLDQVWVTKCIHLCPNMILVEFGCIIFTLRLRLTEDLVVYSYGRDFKSYFDQYLWLYRVPDGPDISQHRQSVVYVYTYYRIIPNHGNNGESYEISDRASYMCTHFIVSFQTMGTKIRIVMYCWHQLSFFGGPLPAEKPPDVWNHFSSHTMLYLLFQPRPSH